MNFVETFEDFLYGIGITFDSRACLKAFQVSVGIDDPGVDFRKSRSGTVSESQMASIQAFMTLHEFSRPHPSTGNEEMGSHEYFLTQVRQKLSPQLAKGADWYQITVLPSVIRGVPRCYIGVIKEGGLE